MATPADNPGVVVKPPLLYGAALIVVLVLRWLLWLPRISSGRIRAVRENQHITSFMVALLRLLASFVADLFKSRRRLEAEILCLRHQLNIALRRRPSRLPLRGSDRALLVWMSRCPRSSERCPRSIGITVRVQSDCCPRSSESARRSPRGVSLVTLARYIAVPRARRR